MTSESADQPTPQGESLPPRSSARSVILALLVLLALAAAVAGFPLWRETAGLPAAPGGGEVEGLKIELATLSVRLAQLESRPAAPAPAVSDERLAALEQAVKSASGAGGNASAALAGEVDSLAKQIADLRRTSADAAALLRLSSRIEAVEAGLREMQARRASAAALLLAVGQLREAVDLGRGFDAELRALRVLAGENAELLKTADALKDQAAGGIRTRAALVEAFTPLAPRIIRAEILPEDEGWQRRVADRMLALVTIRREDGSAAGASAAAVVARAQAGLTRADLAAALADLEALGGAPAEAAAPWIAEARARLAADRAVSELAAQTLALAGAKP